MRVLRLFPPPLPPLDKFYENYSWISRCNFKYRFIDLSSLQVECLIVASREGEVIKLAVGEQSIVSTEIANATLPSCK